jgi:DNA-directed RNA polymerase omega subunit
MTLDSLENFTKYTKNRYEAIIVAAKHARKINEILENEESSGDEEKTDRLKMEEIVSKSLREVLEGKVKYERPKKSVSRKF